MDLVILRNAQLILLLSAWCVGRGRECLCDAGRQSSVVQDGDFLFGKGGEVCGVRCLMCLCLCYVLTAGYRLYVCMYVVF